MPLTGFNMLRFKTVECAHLCKYIPITMEMEVSETSLVNSTFIEHQPYKDTGKDEKAKCRTGPRR